MWNKLKVVALLGSAVILLGVASAPASAQDTYEPGIVRISTSEAGPLPATDEELLAAINALGAAPAIDSAAAGDEVLGVSITADALAFTGNEVSVPIAVGASLIGAGSLLLLASRKHRKD